MLDAARLNPQRTVTDEIARLNYAIQNIRKKKNWETIPIVLIPEDGPPGAGENLYAHVRDAEPIICMAEAGSAAYGARRFGVPKTQDITIRMKDATLMAMVDDPKLRHAKLGLSKELFSLQHHARGEPVSDTLDKLRTQMYNYRVHIKKAYTENANDDLLVALMTLLNWSEVFISARDGGNPDYKAFHRRWIDRRN